ncbi:MAG: C15orf41 family protein [Candidatus Altiarchaeota archaeon]
MDANEFERLYRRLKSEEDIEILSKKEKYPKDLLLVILTQKIVRDTKRGYYSVKNKSPEIMRQWRSGKTMLEISKDLEFPPALTASLLMQHMGVSKKRFRTHMQEPTTIEDPRIKKELNEAMKHELVYSPEATRIQWERGKEVERKVKEWLERMGKRFKTEKQLRDDHAKTPDFLLETPIKHNGRWIKWIECKASFGDMTEVRRDYNKQLSHYTRMFGEGIVVYWYGYIENAKKELNDSIILVDKEFFRRDMI